MAKIEILGTMRCPVGALVYRSKGKTLKIEDEQKDPETGRVLSRRCGKSAKVSKHATLKKTLVAYCPTHEAVDCDEGIWMSQVKRD